MCVTVKVTGDNLALVVAPDALHGILQSLLHQFLSVIILSRLFQVTVQVHYQHAEGHANVKLAFLTLSPQCLSTFNQNL